VSKMSLKPLEGSALRAVIESAHIKDSGTTGSAPAVYPAPSPASGSDSESTSQHYFGLGSRYFLERRLPQAIVQYQKALELEKKERKLPRDEWRVLVDNLGMSYGMTGDLKHADEVFQYGISQDPTYPNFYYSMACVYGERNDLENAMKYLKTAFRYKENLIAGETMPDPRRDSSFRYFMKNPRFLKLVDSLTNP
ncbi:MAG TPA: tetratricopeptide repeat protein, partial [Terriglobia bacterium]|nr:tetratricopeptide repeat protein [Terriglobia bacterium]